MKRSFLGAAISLVALLSTRVPIASAEMRMLPPASGCTNAMADGATAVRNGLDPGQLAAAYGLTSLWNSADLGQGQSVALLEVQTRLGPPPTGFANLSQCYGPYLTPIEEVVPAGGAEPPAEDESQFDPEVVAAAAPKAQIYMFESAETSNTIAQQVPKVLPGLLQAALDPNNTGGKLVDAISTSNISCEAYWTKPEVAAMQRALRRAASLGVPVFAAAGDWGSAGWTKGTANCFSSPVPSPPQYYPGLVLGDWYPGSSPLVTSVGGTELQVDGGLPLAGDAAGGTITGEVVWNEPYSSFGGNLAGAGGPSSLFTVSDAPWERDLHLSGAEEKPDISALAGSPQYLYGGLGTSGSSPYMAGATAVLDQELIANHRPRVGFLNAILWHLASLPAFYSRVFNDVTEGTNQLQVGLGCCSAGPGYDEASGLGSVNFDKLATALVLFPKLETLWTKLRLAAFPQNSTGIPESIEAATNNTIVGTPYWVNIFLDGHFFTKCKTSVCAASYAPTNLPLGSETISFSADVGYSKARPFSARALVSGRGTAVIHHTRPCTSPDCT